MNNKNKIFLLLLINLFATTNCNVVSMSGKLPPGVNGRTYREVSLQLRIMHIYDINLDHETVKLSGYFRQSWNDSRMMGNQWDGITPSGRKFFLMNKAQSLWLPDTFISNSIDHTDRESYSGDPHGAYHYLRVYTDGEVLYSQMIDIMIKTTMNLKYYPFNVLNITLDVESYGYPDHTLRYSPGSSSDNDGLIIKIQDVPGYKINESLANSFLTTAEYSTGNFSKIEMSFSLIPNDSTLFILSIPNLLLIVVSSFIFWMEIRRKLSERLGLGITALLADFALSFSLPVPDTPDFLYVREYINISYIFIGFTIFFTFAEFVIESVIDVRQKRNELQELQNRVRVARQMERNSQWRSEFNNELEQILSDKWNLNKLMRDGLDSYRKSYDPEKPVHPIKAAFGVFYLLCWVSFMIGHIIPGKIIMGKAQQGINYQQEAVEYFPFIFGGSLTFSFVCSVLTYWVQRRAFNKYNSDMMATENSKKYASLPISTTTNLDEKIMEEINKLIRDNNITCKLEPEIMDKISEFIKYKTKTNEFNTDNSIELSNRIQNFGKEIYQQLDNMSCFIGGDSTALDNIVDDIDKTDNSIENNEDNEDNEDNKPLSSENNEEDIDVVEITIKNSEND
jgi:hypothetical protein